MSPVNPGFYDYSTSRLFAALAYGEARGEGIEGIAAVCQVVRNRVLAPRWWGKTWRQVILKPWQFSCFLAQDPNSERLLAFLSGSRTDDSWRECLWVATGTIRGSIRDMTGGANHYCSRLISPPIWAKSEKLTRRIGEHLFYKL